MATPVEYLAEQSDNVQSHDWLGDRDPSPWDVHDANQVPPVSFLHRFKAALLLSDDAIGYRQYVSQTSTASAAIEDGGANLSAGLVRNYTYPIAILSGLPQLPENEVLTRAQSQFSASFGRHIFLSAVPFSAPSQGGSIIPPYLKIGLACLAIAASSKPEKENEGLSFRDLGPFDPSASELFLAGDTLWGAMMEVDNREARLLESVMAGCLYATFGILSANEDFWTTSSSAISGTATMARRLRMHYGKSSASMEKLFIEHNANTSSLLMSYLFLTDVIRTVHCGGAACISTKELFLRMPSSPYNFHQIYSWLVSGARNLPHDMKAEADSLLLLTGICADIIYIHHSFPNLAMSGERHGQQSSSNPYAPLSPASEVLRNHFILNAALTRWQEHFGEFATSPDILKLPQVTAYPPSPIQTSTLPEVAQETTLEISDEAVNFAWLILDNSNARPDISGTNVSIWLPVVLFLAALAIWYRLQQQNRSSNLKTGSMRVLNMFKGELRHLPWPCCAEMCFTLDKLMDQSINNP